MMFCVRVMLRDAVDERLAMIEEGTFRATLDVTVTSHSASLRSRRVSETERSSRACTSPGASLAHDQTATTIPRTLRTPKVRAARLRRANLETR